MYSSTATANSKNAIQRENYLDLILKNFNAKSPKNMSLVGGWFAGKSVLLKQVQAETEAVYVDLSKISLSPENFAVEYISAAASWHLGKQVGLDEAGVDDSSKEIVAAVKNELEKIKPDHSLLLELALSYPEKLGKKLVILDEFWKITEMNNFEKIKDAVKLYMKVTSEQSTSYLISGSAVFEMNRISKELGYDVLEISGLRLADVGDEDVLHYSDGVPAYVDAIKSRGGDARSAFLTETLWKQGKIYNSCSFILNEALSRARGKSLLFSVLKLLSKSSGLRLNEISRGVYRSSAVTKNLVDRLVAVDLVEKQGNLYVVKDSVLKFWLKQVTTGVEFDFEPDKNTLNKIEVDF